MKYLELLDEMNALGLALNTMGYDTQTIAPEQGAPYRNKAMAYLSGMYFKLLTSEAMADALEEAVQSEDDVIRRSAEILKEDLDKSKNIPADRYVAFSQLQNDAQLVWERAKEEADYSIFKETLASLIAFTKEMVNYRNDGKPTYESLLDDYEAGLTEEKVDAFFDTLAQRLVPFIDVILEHQPEKPAFMDAFVSIEKQEEITRLIADHLGYTNDFGYIAVAAHPFSSTFSINDSRITTHYHETNFTDSIFSTIHEIGHSMYGHQVDPAYEGTPLAGSMSYSMHESQSRFLENMVGRSKAFWTPLYPKLQSIIPDVLNDVTLDTFILGINFVERSDIRTQADEVTYPLHILVRYQIERDIFAGNYDIDTLNTRFKEAMTQYIGVTPESDARGILQDVHWSGASFGYFPTYALGTAYAAQFAIAMEKDLNLNELLEAGDFKTIFAWLKENIHRDSGYLDTQVKIEKVTGEPFNPNYYVDYIIEKYTTLLGIEQ